MNRSDVTATHDWLTVTAMCLFLFGLYALIRAVDWLAETVGTVGILALLGIVVCVILRRVYHA